MANKDEYEQYAAELNRRFDEFTRWAREHWPRPDFPLMDSDFAASRRELGEILGPKLGDGEEKSSRPGPDDGQYIETNPMPWP